MMSWDNISIRKYDEIVKVLEDNTLSDLDKNIGLLSIVKDISTDVIEDMTVIEVQKLMGEISFINNPPQSKKRIPDTIMINGKKYEIMKNIKKITISQYVDFQTYLELGKVENILSVFIIPQGKKYGSYDIDEVIDDIYNHLDIGMAKEISFFFHRALYKSMKVTLIYLAGELWMRMIKERDKMKKMEMKKVLTEIQGVIHLLKSGDI